MISSANLGYISSSICCYTKFDRRRSRRKARYGNTRILTDAGAVAAMAVAISREVCTICFVDGELSDRTDTDMDFLRWRELDFSIKCQRCDTTGEKFDL